MITLDKMSSGGREKTHLLVDLEVIWSRLMMNISLGINNNQISKKMSYTGASIACIVLSDCTYGMSPSLKTRF